MPRVSNGEVNELTIDDHVSGDKCKIFYRIPTPSEHAKYTNNLTQRKGRKVVNCTGETRQQWGLDILMGFREGDYLKPGKPDDPFYNSKYRAVRFSSDKTSSCYDPDWKSAFQKIAPDHIELLAIHAFENSASVDDGPDLDGDTPESD